MMEYEKMLERGIKSMPESVFEKQRFEIPNVKGHLEGNKTIVTNFTQIAGHFNRKVEHMLKYLLKELAAPGDIRGGMLVLGTKVPASKINEKIRKYATEFVLCAECGKPDTKIEKEKDITYMKCTACGAKRAIKAYI